LVAAHQYPLSHENDAHPCAVQQDLLFAQGALKLRVRHRAERLQFWGAVRGGHETVMVKEPGDPQICSKV
jgi:hypothetical protein